VTGRRGPASGWLSAALLLVGLPVGLVRSVGWPLPHHWPTRAQWVLWLQNPIADHRALVDLFAIALWLVWAVLLYAVLTDAAAQLRRAGRRLWLLARRIRPISARNLVGAAVVGTGTAAVTVVATAHPPAANAASPATPDTSAPPVSSGPMAPVDDQILTAASDRVGLPDGGWLTRHTAAAVAASGAMVWRERRRHYRPRLFVGATRDDPDLTPLPTAAAAVIQQVQPPPEQPPTTTGTLDKPTAPPSTGAAAMVGESVGQPLPLSALPRGGVGLVGPGAADAARGVLIAALLSSDRPAAAPTVVTTKADLAALLGTATPPDAVPGLLIATDLPEAITAVEEIAMARADPATKHADPPDTAHVVLLAAAPTDPQAARQLRVVLTLAHDKALTGVLLGDWSPGDAWRLQGDGTVDNVGESPTRLSVLSEAAASDLLAVYREAHTQRATPAADGDLHSEALSAARVPRQIPAHHSSPLAATAAAAPRPDRILLTVLGPPAVYRPGHAEAIRWPRTAALPVLVYLAVNRAGATSTDLATVLWPQLHPGSTTNRIYNIISTVHRTLDTAAGGPTITRAGDRYRLNPDHVEVDLWQLQEAVRAAGGPLDPLQRFAALRRMIDTYTGELAEGWPWPWLDPHREATRRQILDAYTTLADEDTDPATAAQLLRAAVGVNPDNHELRRRVMVVEGRMAADTR
jgi:DNA-binding SARP family transcriptional activator